MQGSLTAYVAPSPRGQSRTLPAVEGMGSASRSEARGDEDFAGLRAYEPGMPLKHMAWKVLARGGEAAVRSYSSLAAQPEWLEWSFLEDQDTETRLSQLCLWVLESEAAQRVYGLRIPGKEIPLRAARRIVLRVFGRSPSTGLRSRGERQNRPYEQLVAISVCLALAMAAHSAHCRSGCSRPSRGGRHTAAARAPRPRRAAPRACGWSSRCSPIALLFFQFHTFNGLTAGTALLALMAGLKLLETETRRDIHVITLIIYFVSVAALLEGESFWLLAYLIGVCWLTTATLLRLTSTAPVPGLAPQSALCRTNNESGSASGAGVLAVLPAARLAAVALAGRCARAGSGLSDSMSPGDIDRTRAVG